MQKHLVLYLICNDPELAAYAFASGIDRIFVDLEIYGKRERQIGLDTPINLHEVSDIAAIRRRGQGIYILARLNPLYTGTRNEIDAVLSAGANAVMLPMFRHPRDVREFAEILAGRAAFIPLIETHEAAISFSEWADTPGISEVYIGLNDLRISLRHGNIFTVLVNGYLDRLVAQISARGIPFGFGGLGRLSAPEPVPARLLLAEHARLGSSSVILSRAFHQRSRSLREFTAAVDSAEEVSAIRRCWDELQLTRPAERERLAAELRECIVALEAKTKTAGQHQQ